MQSMLMARILIRNTVDTFLDWYLGRKLDMLTNEHHVVHIINLLYGKCRLHWLCSSIVLMSLSPLPPLPLIAVVIVIVVGVYKVDQFPNFFFFCQ